MTTPHPGVRKRRQRRKEISQGPCEISKLFLYVPAWVAFHFFHWKMSLDHAILSPLILVLQRFILEIPPVSVAAVQIYLVLILLIGFCFLFMVKPHCVTQTNFELASLLSQLPKCWDCKHVSPCLTRVHLLKLGSSVSWFVSCCCD